MCRRVECRKCGRPTFAGCGAHVEQVLGDVPIAQRCQCRASPAKGETAPDTGTRPRSWLGTLLGRTNKGA
jgi:hypothetical protein